jgi:dTDP-4-amino-4,6-dideoxygalactose transaminase
MELGNSVKDFFRVRHVFFTSSGRGALALILDALGDLTQRREVILPSYTCFSTPAAVVKAGLRLVICDIERRSLHYDIEKARKRIGGETLCIVASHLFGIPCLNDALLAIARANGSFVVEDCAQALGAELNGKKVGTLGDIAFFSFGRGKNICAVSGGLIIANDDKVARAVARRISRLRPPGFRAQMAVLLQAISLNLFSRPVLYWVPQGLPFLQLGKTHYSPGFPVERLSSFAAGLAGNWLSKLKFFNKTRRVIAQTYRRELLAPGIRFLEEPENACSVYPRFPVVVQDKTERDRICRELSSLGISGSLFYPTGIAHIPELNLSEQDKEELENGNRLAELLLTLPTHPSVCLGDMDKIASIFRKEAQGAEQLAAPKTWKARGEGSKEIQNQSCYLQEGNVN